MNEWGSSYSTSRSVPMVVEISVAARINGVWSPFSQMLTVTYTALGEVEEPVLTGLPQEGETL